MKLKMPYAMNGCRITDDWRYKGMRVVFMENELIRLGILVDRGSDIFEFRYKPLDLNFLLQLPGKLRNLQSDFSQMRNTQNQFEDHYYGGWQEILPNSPAFVYRGASLGQHGEISLIPWKYAILDEGPESVSVKLWNQPVRVPLKIEKTLTINRERPALQISEKLTNLSQTHLDLMWGHHIAFGLPFLESGASIDVNARKVVSEPTMPEPRMFKPGIITDWPMAEKPTGGQTNASIVPDVKASPYSDLSYLWDFNGNGRYSIRNVKDNIGFSLDWDSKVFKYLWYWQERYATKDFPWWGSCYTIALEPWTSMWKPDAPESIKKNEWLRLEAQEFIETELKAGILTE
jgi:hypothetical protein